jgi:GDP-4-dehydro-6-deoxy-D-mannose reductase
VSRVLVTGARGFVGRYLVEHLETKGAEVTAWGREHVDLLDRRAVSRAMAELRPSVVYHCAGSAHVGQSFSNIADTFAANVLGTHHVLDALRNAGVRARVLITGSSLVYRQSERALKEEDPTGPATPYAVSKLAQEMLGRRGISEDRQHVLLTRPFNHTGPRQDPTYAAPTFAQQIALIEKRRMRPEIVVGNLDASRDLHDVRDTVRAYTTIVERGEPGRVYNVCSGEAFKIRDVLERLVAMSKVPVTITVDPARYRPCDNLMLWGDRSRIERELGWKPEIPLDQTLSDLLDYWRKEVE